MHDCAGVHGGWVTGKMYVNTTMWEAIGPKTETQGVLMVQNDSIAEPEGKGHQAAARDGASELWGQHSGTDQEAEVPL